MGFSKRGTEVALVVIVAMSMVVAASAAISCGTVASDLVQCRPYLTGQVALPPSGCCAGVKKLYSLTQNSRPDRITSCGCIKSISAGIAGLNPSKVSSLPGQCGVNLGYPISAGTNCNTIP